MMEKTQKIEQIITKAASEYAVREGNKTSVITITRTELDRDGGRATVYCTVFPGDKEREASDFLQRREIDFKEYVRATTKLSRIPFLVFAIDKGEKNRNRIDELLAGL